MENTVGARERAMLAIRPCRSKSRNSIYNFLANCTFLTLRGRRPVRADSR